MNRKEEFETIYNATFETVSKHVYFKVAKIEDAQDIVQEVFIDFDRYITSKGKNVENVQAYLIQMANNKLSHYYKDKTFETTLIKDKYLLESIADEDDLEFDVLEKTTLEEIWNEVSTFSILDQHILIDYYRFGLNFREISERYHMPESTIKSRCQNAIKKLKEKFK